jgi:hypothetical protein
MKFEEFGAVLRWVRRRFRMVTGIIEFLISSLFIADQRNLETEEPSPKTRRNESEEKNTGGNPSASRQRVKHY